MSKLYLPVGHGVSEILVDSVHFFKVKQLHPLTYGSSEPPIVCHFIQMKYMPYIYILLDYKYIVFFAKDFFAVCYFPIGRTCVLIGAGSQLGRSASLKCSLSG